MKLNQIIAIETAVKNRAHQYLSDLYKIVQAHQLFLGFSKQYRPKDEDGEMFPPESKKVQVNSLRVLSDIKENLTELFDVTLAKDTGNSTATADIQVNGEPLAKDVPVTYLLFLEKQLKDLYTLIGKMPTLDSSEEWEFDETQTLYRTDPVETIRTKKVQKALVLYPATKEHPAQTKDITEDVIIGHWNTTKFSGALTVPQQREVLKKIEKLQAAVKMAREEANTKNIEQPKVGDKLLGWVLG